MIQRELRDHIYNDERRSYEVRIETAETAYQSRDENLIRGRARIIGGSASQQFVWHEGVIDTRRNRVNNLRWGTALIEIRDSSGGAADYEIEVRWD